MRSNFLINKSGYVYTGDIITNGKQTAIVCTLDMYLKAYDKPKLDIFIPVFMFGKAFFSRVTYMDGHVDGFIYGDIKKFINMPGYTIKLLHKILCDYREKHEDLFSDR